MTTILSTSKSSSAYSYRVFKNMISLSENRRESLKILVPGAPSLENRNPWAESLSNRDHASLRARRGLGRGVLTPPQDHSALSKTRGRGGV